MSTTDPGMAELGRARAELKAALFKGVKGTAAEERAEHLIDEHQAALKHAHAHRLADMQRANCDQVTCGPYQAQCACKTQADLIDPEVQR